MQQLEQRLFANDIHFKYIYISVEGAAYIEWRG